MLDIPDVDRSDAIACCCGYTVVSSNVSPGGNFSRCVERPVFACKSLPYKGFKLTIDPFDPYDRNYWNRLHTWLDSVSIIRWSELEFSSKIRYRQLLISHIMRAS